MHTDFRKLVHEIEILAHQLARQYDFEHLDGPQGTTLQFLSDHDQKNIYQKDIEEFHQISKSAASHLVKRMEKNNFIQTSTLPEDKRHKIIQLTDLGYEKSVMMDQFFTLLKDLIFADIPQADLDHFDRTLQLIEQNIINANQTLESEEEIND